SVTVWAHHMYTTGAVMLDFFAFMTMLIAVPTGVKFFNWVGPMWRGSLTFETPMLFTLGFLTTFIFGGLTGLILSSPVLAFHISDASFVVGVVPCVMAGPAVFGMYAGFSVGWPELFGHMLHERVATLRFWLLPMGFPIALLGLDGPAAYGAPRR